MKIIRPLSPHLTIYMPQQNSTFPIFHRIPGAFSATMVLFSLIVSLQIGEVILTYTNTYQSLFYVIEPKFALTVKSLTFLALCYHMVFGVRHLWWDLKLFRLSIFQNRKKNGF
uniref:Succinate dehydrogenase cytochrome subunit 3 n=1 Tax=Araucaria cunninghamii TaxID=56994 RepID=A0A8F4MHK0_ARACU|nr:succinate dehydrogenase cytochrome subunit 3 [Araucaria cunninghamii]